MNSSTERILYDNNHKQYAHSYATYKRLNIMICACTGVSFPRYATLEIHKGLPF